MNFDSQIFYVTARRAYWYGTRCSAIKAEITIGPWHRNILLIQTQILFIAGPVNHSNDAFQPLNRVPSSSTHKVIEHQMSLFAMLLTSLFLFPGFAVAGIDAPSCLPTWEWVCMLSLPLCILSYYLICWHHIDTFRHSTRLAKIRA